MNWKIFIISVITLISLFILPGASAPGAAPDKGGHDESGVRISANKSIFAPDDTMRISIGVTAARIGASVVDVHVLARKPDGGFSNFYKKTGWIVVNEPLHEIASIPLKNERIGPYTWYVVLCPPGNDPFDLKGLVAAANLEVFILPDGPDSSAGDDKLGPVPGFGPPVIIAHAGGALDGRTGQNSLEALNSNHAKGHRYFEIDFCWTSDNRLVLIHDWGLSFTGLFENANERPSLERFESMKMKHGMTQMSLDSLLTWLAGRDDVSIITDVKDRNVAALKRIAAKSGSLRKRFIPQVYAPSELAPVRKLGFEKVILTLYRSSSTDAEVARFAAASKLWAVTMPVRRTFSSFPFRELNRKGVRAYVHTINKIEVLNHLRGKGVHGIYTDTIPPGELNR